MELLWTYTRDQAIFHFVLATVVTIPFLFIGRVRRWVLKPKNVEYARIPAIAWVIPFFSSNFRPIIHHLWSSKQYLYLTLVGFLIFSVAVLALNRLELLFKRLIQKMEQGEGT